MGEPLTADPARPTGSSIDTLVAKNGEAKGVEQNSEHDATLARMAREQEHGGKGRDGDLFLSGPEQFEHIHQPPFDDNGGSGQWMLTFADLMSLLLCFFILLFAMAELDVKKFSQVAQALAGALGGGKVIYLKEPGPSVVETKGPALVGQSIQRMETEYYARQLRLALEEEISQEKLLVEDVGQIITIHILQHGSFEPASAILDEAFLPTARKIRDALVDMPGNLTVAGHTDNLPISPGRFLSNWELAGARAFSVIHELLKEGVLPPQRFVLAGHADTSPRVDNDTAENRAKNRRVEIIVDQRGNSGETPNSYDFLRRSLEPELLGGTIEVQSGR